MSNQEAPGRVWIQIAQVGSFRGHPQGAFELNPHIFSKIVDNFNRVGLPVPIDAEHASELPATEGSIPTSGAPAMGWIHALDNRGPAGLWAHVEWLEPAKSYIKAGRYRYISPAIRWRSRDRVTGEEQGPRLSSAGITNSPFLHRLQPLVAKYADGVPSVLCSAYLAETTNASANDARVYATGEYLPKLKSALRLEDGATPREVGEHFTRLRLKHSALDGAMDGLHDGRPLGDYLGALRECFAPPLSMTWGELFECIEEMIEHAIHEHEERYHEGEPAEEEGEDEPLEPEEETEMSDTTTASTTAPEEVQTLSAQLAARDAEVSELRAQLESQVKWRAEREAADVEARVSDAIATYATSRGLSEASRSWLTPLCAKSPDEFAKAYPPVDADKRHLLQNLTGESRDPHAAAVPAVPATSAPDAAAVPTLSLLSLAEHIARTEGVAIDVAQIKAEHIIKAGRKAALSK